MKTQWKRRASQASLLAFMVTMAFGAVGSASAADTASTEIKPSITVTSALPVMATSAVQLRTSSGLLMQPTHERNYLKLLVTTYAPESLTEWKQALEDRKQAESDMPKPTFAKKIAIKGAATALPTSPDASENKMFKLEPAQPVPASPDGKAAQLVPSKQLTTMTIIKDSAEAGTAIQALPLEGAIAGDIMKAEPSSEVFKRQQKLAEAVEADDAAAIQSLLPELLVDYKKETESLRTIAKTMKEHAAKATEEKADDKEESN
ncbi:hypothetical protein [Paenibacillus aceris]|uniref:Uncharacterized protein n=1 Tax=Paenibacillus aceris TaxID=869555 RepID=A0ABS4I626_9BACL|nr:hypothetical protein [Paenibacillus aceris]MBP1966364.1 hypothetical protein [Paenibacillus aceris]NHW38622.1 hypothetical protein [Paenibacillus aceris]